MKIGKKLEWNKEIKKMITMVEKGKESENRDGNDKGSQRVGSSQRSAGSQPGGRSDGRAAADGRAAGRRGGRAVRRADCGRSADEANPYGRDETRGGG